MKRTKKKRPSKPMKKRVMKKAPKVLKRTTKKKPALETSQFHEDFHLIAEAIPHIVWTGDPDGTIDYMNKRWFAYTGLSENETYYHSKTAVHPDDYHLYLKKWREAVRTKKPYDIEYRFRRAKDGMYRWHLGRGLPLRNRYGKVIKWFGTCTDIHDQKMAEAKVRELNSKLESKVEERTKALLRQMIERLRAEEQVREHSKLLEQILDTLPVAAIASDRKGEILHANERFCHMFHLDLDPELLKGRDCIQTIKDSTSSFLPANTYDDFIKNITFQETAPFQTEISSNDNNTYEFEYVPIIENRTTIGHLFLYRDITEEKRIDTAKTEFMSLASHQLRTPLTSIRWALGRLHKMARPDVSDMEKMLMTQAKSYAAAMADTISTMLSISRVEAGIVSPTMQTVRLYDFFQDAVQKMKDMYVAKSITVKIVASKKLTFVTDQKLLKEIFDNLLTNAIKYTSANGVVTVGATQTKKSIRMYVQDTGYGIAPEEQERIFKKFFRGGNITSVDTEGTGLGLYLVSRLVDILGGKLFLASDVGKGSTFSVQFPK